MAREKTGGPKNKGPEEEPTTWGKWLAREMKHASVSAAELSRMSGGEITESNISYWVNDRSGINSENALLIVQLLWGRQPADAPPRDEAEFIVEALLLAGHPRAAKLVNPEAAELFLARAQEHESIQLIRASHLPEEDKEDFIEIARRKLARVTAESRGWIAAGENGDAA